MVLSAIQQQSVDIILRAAMEWDDLHDVPYFLAGELNQLENQEIDQLLDLHLASGEPALFSSQRFDALNWEATSVPYPSEELSLLEHVSFASNYLMPLAEIMWMQVSHPEDSVVFLETEIIQQWWTSLETLTVEKCTRQRRTDAIWKKSLGDSGGDSNWEPFGNAISKDSGKSFEVVFDGEEIALPQVHIFLRLVIDTYLKGLGANVSVVAIGGMEEAGPIFITFEPNLAGLSDLTLIYPS